MSYAIIQLGMGLGMLLDGWLAVCGLDGNWLAGWLAGWVAEDRVAAVLAGRLASLAGWLAGWQGAGGWLDW